MKGRLSLGLILGALVAIFGLLYLLRPDPSPPTEAGKESEVADQTIVEPRPADRTLMPSQFPGEVKEDGEKKSGEPHHSRFAMKMEPEPALSGIDFAPATDDDRKRAGVTDQYGQGVTVTHIHPDSSAAEVAMQIGDVIVRAQKENVSSVEDLRRIVGDRDHTVVNFMRDGQLLSVVLQKPFVPPPKTP